MRAVVHQLAKAKKGAGAGRGGRGGEGGGAWGVPDGRGKAHGIHFAWGQYSLLHGGTTAARLHGRSVRLLSCAWPGV